VFVDADTIVHNIHLTLLYNKDNFSQKFTKRISQPLLKITASAPQSKRYVISFLRRLVKAFGAVLVTKRQSVKMDGRPASKYSYYLVRYM
jgi:hypothetical protein